MFRLQHQQFVYFSSKAIRDCMKCIDVGRGVEAHVSRLLKALLLFHLDSL